MKYKFNREKFSRIYSAFFHTEEPPEDSLDKMFTATTEVIISAYEKGQKGEPLTELIPWIVEA